MRILFIAGYGHPAFHRKVELLANDPAMNILHVTLDSLDRTARLYASANGTRSYEVRTFRGQELGKAGDPHRTLLQTVDFCARSFKPDLFHVESDLETLGTAQAVLANAVFARSSKLVLYSWQNIPRPRKARIRILVHLLLRAADHICCASRESHRRGAPAGSSRNQQHHAAGWTGQHADFRRKYDPKLRVSLGVDGPIVGYIGRLVSEKGVDLLLQACARLQIVRIFYWLGMVLCWLIYGRFRHNLESAIIAISSALCPMTKSPTT